MIYENLNKLVKSVVGCSDNDLLLLNSLLKEYKYKKNSIVVNKGKVANMMYFINEGCLRAYFTIEGKEIITHLSSKNEFITAFLSFTNRENSDVEVQCLTDCVLLGLTWENLQMLTGTYNIWYKFERKMKENALVKNEKRIRHQIILTAKQRYKMFVSEYPYLVQNCPIKYIASYLGIHPESLSRIRKEVVV